MAAEEAAVAAAVEEAAVAAAGHRYADHSTDQTTTREPGGNRRPVVAVIGCEHTATDTTADCGTRHGPIDGVIPLFLRHAAASERNRGCCPQDPKPLPSSSS